MHHFKRERGGSTNVHRFDHAGNKQALRSSTRFLIYMNISLINWFFKKQSTIETSVFDAELVAMKVGVEILHAIKYKLRIMCIPRSEVTFINGDDIYQNQH